MQKFLLAIFQLLFVICVVAPAQAEHAVGGNLIMGFSSQDDIDTLISRANSRVGGITTSEMGTMWELAPFYTYRFQSSIFALHIRPSYMFQNSTGSGTGGDFDYKLSGFSLFPMLRMYVLENSFIKFIMQAGLGWGRLSGSIEEADAKVEFAGSAFGAIFGLGAEFCFTPNHCMNIEGNLRYLPIERNIASSQSGTWGADGISQPTGGDTTYEEVEFDNQDLKTTMSGIQGVIGYTYWF